MDRIAVHKFFPPFNVKHLAKGEFVIRSVTSSSHHFIINFDIEVKKEDQQKKREKIMEKLVHQKYNRPLFVEVTFLLTLLFSTRETVKEILPRV